MPQEREGWDEGAKGKKKISQASSFSHSPILHFFSFFYPVPFFPLQPPLLQHQAPRVERQG